MKFPHMQADKMWKNYITLTIDSWLIQFYLFVNEHYCSSAAQDYAAFSSVIKTKKDEKSSAPSIQSLIISAGPVQILSSHFRA